MVDCACTNFPSGLGNVTIGASLLFGPSPVATHRLAVRGDAHIWSEGLFPLTLRGGDAAGHMFTSVIQFKAANDHGLWQLGSGGLNGTYQEFSLLDQVNGVYRL